ncbi:MAG: diguanylate cyclase [Desulfobacterales bacterium]
MEHKDLLYFLQHVGTDPSRLIFEDDLTGIYNRRFLLSYLQHKVSWDSLESRPVSLLMMDLDYFKEINDAHGHDVGDKALIWMAGLVKKQSGDKGLAIRYGGDEFMILLPGTDKESALKVGEALMQQIHNERFYLDKVGDDLNITISVGVASAPDDAQNGKDLIRKADTALYYAKRFGRDRLASAEQVSLQDVFPKTALHQLDKAKITGRKTQLIKVAQALKKFGQHQNQFLVIKGANGMGKTEFLGAIRQSLPKNKICQVAVNGIAHEAFRPYYMITNILIELLNQETDKGEKVLKDLTPKEANYLSYILPQLGEPQDFSDQEDEKTLREQLFDHLTHFILKLLDSRHFLLLIDDMHYSDQATLFLLRHLLLRKDIPIFICGTAVDIRLDDIQGETIPLEQFLAAFDQELNISRLNLTPLTANDIADHFQRIFPNISLPENFEKVLAQLTQGNALFISGILRKLVLDGKVTLTGQQWVVKDLEDGYLPNTLEEIVGQKIAALDEEGRKLLDHAAIFGENVTLSMLAGGSESMEIKVQEFIDQAITQGLISSEFKDNDEIISFLSHRVLEITYGAIREDRKQELHGRIGAYQKNLHHQHLLPSAATLAYHFQLSANLEQARSYQESQQVYNNKIFNAQEAIHYTGEILLDTAPKDFPLDPESLAQVPGLIHLIFASVRNIKLYPSGSSAILDTTKQLKERIDKILANNERLNISQVKKTLMVNGEPLDVTEFKSIAENFEKFLSRLELTGIAFYRGLREKELTVMLESLSRVSTKITDRSFWKRFSKEQQLSHIEFKQVRYTTMRGTEKEARHQEIGQENGKADPMTVSAELFDHYYRELDEEDLIRLPQVIRCLLTSAKNIKFYPPESKAVSYSIEELSKVLHDILVRQPVLTLSQVGDGLLVNGVKIDTTDFKTMADSFLTLLEKIGLSSLTFLKTISSQELTTFISAIGQFSDDELNSEFWHSLAMKQNLSGILFDQSLYEILGELVEIGSDHTEPIEDPIVENHADLAFRTTVKPEMDEPISESLQVKEGSPPLTEAAIESIAQQLHDQFLKGSWKKLRQLVNQLFQGFADQTHDIRAKVITACGSLLDDLDFASQSQWIELLSEPLLIILPEEEHFDILKQTSLLLSRTTAHLIQFGDYEKACQIHSQLRLRWQQLQNRQDQPVRQEEITSIQKLDPKTQGILLEDMKSQDPSRLQLSTRLLGSMGPAALPVLIEIIKKEDVLKLRQIAAHLLGNLGPVATKILRRELILEGFAEERVRILDVIDNITRNLKTELAYTLDDESPEVRRAAFRLAERLNNEDVISLLLDYASQEDQSMAVFAIKSLGKLKSTGVVDALVSLMDSTQDTERLIACCRVLGKIADPAGIEPLAKIMAPGGFFSFRKKKNTRVRATAAFALSQIDHPKVTEVLALYVEDRDPRIRQIARDQLNP